jgi:hypothetical protein
LWDRYTPLSSEELVDMVLRRPSDYTEEGLSVTRAVLEERGINIDAARSKLDEEAARDRERADGERRERERATADLANAGRALGVCCACRETAPARSLFVVAKRPLLGQGMDVADGYVRTSEAILLPIPMCAFCEPSFRVPATLSLAWFAVGFILALLGEIAILVFVPPGLDSALSKILLWIPFGAAILALWIAGTRREAARRRAILRLAALHPAYGRLAGEPRGIGQLPFLFLPPEEMGASKAEVLASMLSDSNPARRRSAEKRLSSCPGSDVVAVLRARLNHPVAAAHAVRALGALRAHDAMDDLRQVARSGPSDAREAAKAVLTALE